MDRPENITDWDVPNPALPDTGMQVNREASIDKFGADKHGHKDPNPTDHADKGTITIAQDWDGVVESLVRLLERNSIVPDRDDYDQFADLFEDKFGAIFLSNWDNPDSATVETSDYADNWISSGPTADAMAYGPIGRYITKTATAFATTDETPNDMHYLSGTDWIGTLQTGNGAAYAYDGIDDGSPVTVLVDATIYGHFAHFWPELDKTVVWIKDDNPSDEITWYTVPVGTSTGTFVITKTSQPSTAETFIQGASSSLIMMSMYHNGSGVYETVELDLVEASSTTDVSSLGIDLEAIVCADDFWLMGGHDNTGGGGVKIFSSIDDGDNWILFREYGRAHIKMSYANGTWFFSAYSNSTSSEPIFETSTDLVIFNPFYMPNDVRSARFTRFHSFWYASCSVLTGKPYLYRSLRSNN